MKRIYKVFPIVLMGCLMATSCSSDWDDHYDEAGITLADGSSVVIYNGSITDYIGGTNDLSKMNALFKRNGIFTTTRADGQYTFIVCTDAQYDESKVTDEKALRRAMRGRHGRKPGKANRRLEHQHTLRKERLGV